MRASRDLPDPTPATEATGTYARSRKSWQTSVTALLFTSLYSSIHRLWVPLGLHFTTLADSPFARVDPAFAPGLFLWGRVRRREQLATADAALAGALVAFGVSESFAIALGHYEGWLALSHGLSSIPMALAAFALLLHRDRRPSLAWPWAGAAAIVFVMAPGVLHEPAAEQVSQAPRPLANLSRPAAVSTLEASTALALCGAQNLAVRLSADLPAASEIGIESCGLRPALVKPAGERLHLKNSSAQAANLHFVAFHGSAQRMGWNLVLRAGATLESPPLALRTGEIGLLYSDSSPTVGLAIVIPPTLSAGHTLHATRLPLTLREETP